MGIPRIIEYLEEDNRLILIEEYISGCSLQDMIDDGKLSLTDIFCYMLELCNILEILHAHSPAIIHRDIKPSNIIITNYNKAVLLDFNAAKYCFPNPAAVPYSHLSEPEHFPPAGRSPDSRPQLHESR